MRMSCNGCRVLRKGCSDDCTIRPCLQWIKTPESQAHATLFLAKFYGRAGLLNLINAGPNHLRPAIFRSLLYEACGRILNPIYGSVGLLWSGNWTLCQIAVDAVLKGSPIKPISPDDDASTSPLLPSAIKDGYNIRHVIKDPQRHHSTSSSTREVDSNKDAAVHRVRNRTRFKKSGSKHKQAVKCSHDQMVVDPTPTDAAVDDAPVLAGNVVSSVTRSLSPSRDSSMSHGTGETNESMVSVEMTEAAAPMGYPVTVRERISNDGCGCEPELDLRLGLGFGFGFGFESSRGSATEPKKSNPIDCVSDKRRTAFATESGPR